MRRLEFAAEFPVLVHAVEPVREPASADFKKGQAQLGKAHRNTLENHAGEVQEDADGESVAVHLGKVIVGGAASGDEKLRLAELRNVAGAGGKQHRLFDVVFVHDLEPRLDLLGRA